jgi:hypothetical protein
VQCVFISGPALHSATCPRGRHLGRGTRLDVEGPPRSWVLTNMEFSESHCNELTIVKLSELGLIPLELLLFS